METENSSESTGSSDNKPETKHKRNLSSLIVLGFSIFLAGCTLSILAPFYTKEAEDHGLSVTSSGTVFASAFVLQVVSTPIFGKYLHQIGSNRLFIIGGALSGVTNIMFGLLPNIESANMFLALSLTIRSLTAVGESAMSSAVYPLAMKCDPGSQSTVLAIMETMFGVGTTIGPFVGGILFEYGGFITPFVTCGGLLLVSALLAYIILPTSDRGDTSDDDTSGSNDDAGDEVIIVGHVSYRSLLRSPLMLIAAIVTFMTGVSTQWYQPSLEPYVRQQFGLSSFQASLLFIIDGGVYSLVAPITGKILDKGADCTYLLGIGSFTICVGYLMLAPVLPFMMEPSLEQIAIGAGIHGLGMAFNFISTISLMTQLGERLSPHLDIEQIHGMATSIWITCESLGGFVGSAGGGAVYDSLGWRHSCILVAMLQVVSLVLVSGVCLVSLVTNMRNIKEKEKQKLVFRDKQNYGTINNNVV